MPVIKLTYSRANLRLIKQHWSSRPSMPMQIDELPSAAMTARSDHGVNWEAACPPVDQGRPDGRHAQRPNTPLALPDLGRNRMSALLVVVFLAVPVSELASFLDLRLGAVPLGLQALEYWAMVALVAASCVCTEAD